MMKKITMTASEWFQEIPSDNRVWNHKECAKVTAVTSFGSMKLDMAMKYNTSSLLYGTLENKNGAIVGDVSKISSNTYNHMLCTTGSSIRDYIVMQCMLTLTWSWRIRILATYCIFGNEPFWAVTSPKKTISSKNREKVLDKIVKFGNMNSNFGPN